jgi:FdhD protein
MSNLKGVTSDIDCDIFSKEEWSRTKICSPVEMELTVYLNSKELVTIMCTPSKLNCLVLGFLYSEGIISSMDDVLIMRVCEDETTADVRLIDTDYELPKKRTLTSGCGGGATFTAEGKKVVSDFAVSPTDVLLQMKSLIAHEELYQISGGIHTSALSDGSNLIVVGEDIGRHNTLDKILGECLINGLSTRDKLVLTTGRVSSEMLQKVARMQSPVLVSRHTPTGKAIELAKNLGIALVGQVRGNRLSVYSHSERLGCSIN